MTCDCTRAGESGGGGAASGSGEGGAGSGLGGVGQQVGWERVGLEVEDLCMCTCDLDINHTCTFVLYSLMPNVFFSVGEGGGEHGSVHQNISILHMQYCSLKFMYHINVKSVSVFFVNIHVHSTCTCI